MRYTPEDLASIRLTAELKAQAKAAKLKLATELAQKGETLQAIAVRVGHGTNVVGRWLRDAGVAYKTCRDEGSLATLG